MEHAPDPQPIFTKIGKRGALVMPALLRKQYGFHEGVPVITEPHPEGVLIKPVTLAPAKAEAAQAWNNWFQTMRDIKLSPEEVTEFKNEGRK